MREPPESVGLGRARCGQWFSATCAGTRIPTLAEAVETIQRGGCTLIERKGGDAAAVVALLRERGWFGDRCRAVVRLTFVTQAQPWPRSLSWARWPPSS